MCRSGKGGRGLRSFEDFPDARLQVLNFSYFEADFPDNFRTATSIRNEIAERGWNKVAA